MTERNNGTDRRLNGIKIKVNENILLTAARGARLYCFDNSILSSARNN